MKISKLNRLMFSGNKDEILKFKPYFEKIIPLKNNQEILTFPFSESKIIFLDCDEKNNNCIEVIKKIRQHDRKSIIVIMSKKRDEGLLLDALSLHLSGYLKKPFKKSDIEKIFPNIIQDLIYLNHEEIIHLKNAYSFNIKQLTLFDEHYNMVKLTKNEIKLMQILSNKNNNYIGSETIEHNIWEEESLEQDCNKRLKHLVYCLRKKLPQDCIINAYNLGYKLITT